MCNRVHAANFVDIPTQGVGYKIFTIRKGDKNGDIQLLTSCHRSSPIMTWDEYFGDPKTHGFCFFLSLDEASRIAMQFIDPLDNYHLVIHRVYYSGGLGEFEECNMINDTVRIALCNTYRRLDCVWESKGKNL